MSCSASHSDNSAWRGLRLPATFTPGSRVLAMTNGTDAHHHSKHHSSGILVGQACIACRTLGDRQALHACPTKPSDDCARCDAVIWRQLWSRLIGGKPKRLVTCRLPRILQFAA